MSERGPDHRNLFSGIKQTHSDFTNGSKHSERGLKGVYQNTEPEEADVEFLNEAGQELTQDDVSDLLTPEERELLLGH